MIEPFGGHKPQIDESCFIAPGAHVIGDVVLEADASVWYNAVLRGDMASIRVGARSNVQDNCTLHCDPGTPLTLGEDVTVGHNAVLHSCTVGDGSLIGMGAVVLSGAVVGKGCLVAAGALVTSGTVIPDGGVAMGVPARIRHTLRPEDRQKLLRNAAEYVRVLPEYRRIQNENA